MMNRVFIPEGFIGLHIRGLRTPRSLSRQPVWFGQQARRAVRVYRQINNPDMNNSFLTRLTFSCICIMSMSSVLSGQSPPTSAVHNDAALSKVTFVSPALAVTRLDAALAVMKAEIAEISSGSAQYQSLDGRYAYYHAMRRMLTDEKAYLPEDVRAAVLRGLGVYASDAHSGIPAVQREQNKQSAINLLKA